MKNNNRSILKTFGIWVLALATIAFIICCVVASETIASILGSVALAIWVNVIDTKLFIGISAFLMGVLLTMAYGGKKQSQLEKDLAAANGKVAAYEANAAYFRNEQEMLANSRKENGDAIIHVLSKNA